MWKEDNRHQISAVRCDLLGVMSPSYQTARCVVNGDPPCDPFCGSGGLSVERVEFQNRTDLGQVAGACPEGEAMPKDDKKDPVVEVAGMNGDFRKNWGK